jgi:hypothetical protein
VDRPKTSAVTGGHVLVEGDDGVASGQLSVLLVHVVGARAGVVSDPDTEVLDLEGVLLMDLSDMSIAVSPHSAKRQQFSTRIV